jgi:hypothetical protein
VIESHTRSTFERKVGGLLKLWLKPRWQSDHLEVFYDGGLETSIVSGCWIHLSAPSILSHVTENALSSITLDTIWAIMHEYVTAILVAIASNTAIPPGFSFGSLEDSDIYDMFFDIFLERFDVDLSTLTLESDQGFGLRKFARLQNFRQRCYLRHVFVARELEVLGSRCN